MNCTQELVRERMCIEPYSGCWLWFGAANPANYGVVVIDGRKKLAHRFSYSQFKGVIPAGKCVCHRCDTPLCVNPDHLFLGTRAENCRDRAKKGRNAIGANSAQSKLADAAVKEMRALRKTGVYYITIAHKFGVTKQAAFNAINRATWRHVV